MERTELRDQFFAEVRSDPYAHLVTRMYSEAWAEGYEQALRDAEAELDPRGRALIEEMRYRKSFGDRKNDAIEHLTKIQHKAEAQLVVALAATGRLLGDRLA